MCIPGRAGLAGDGREYDRARNGYERVRKLRVLA